MNPVARLIQFSVLFTDAEQSSGCRAYIMKDKRWPRLWCLRLCGHGLSTQHAECSSLHLSLWVRGQLRPGFTAFQ